MAKLPSVQRSAMESVEVVNQYINDYMDEIMLSNRGWFHKFKETYKSERKLQKNIIAVSELTLDGNYSKLEKLSKSFDGIIADLDAKTATLKKENEGLSFPTEFSPMFAALSKKYLEMRGPLDELAAATKMAPTNKAPVPANKDASIPVNDNPKRKKNPKEQEQEKKDEETNDNANRFYKKFFEWVGLEKARSAIQKTRGESTEMKGKMDKFATRVGKLATSAFDNILDLPNILTGLTGKFLGSLVGMFTSGLSFALVGIKKLVTTRFGLVGITMALLLTDTVQDWIVNGMKMIFGEETTKKVVNFFKNYDFESILTGAGIGMMIAGPIGAIVGGLLGKLVADMQKLSIPEIENKIKTVSESRENLQKTLNDVVSKIDGLNKEIDKAVAEKNTSLVEYLEKQKSLAETDRERIRLQLKEQDNALEKLKDHKQTIEEFGWFGKFAVTLDNWSKSFNDLWVSYLTPFKDASELKAAYDLKIEDSQKWFGEKWKAFTDWVDYIIDLPNMLLDKMNKFLEEKRNWLYDKTDGWLGTPSAETQKKLDNAAKAGAAVGEQFKSMAPGAGVLAPNNDKNDRMQYLEKQREAIEETRRQRANALINAPTTNTRQTVVNNTSSSTVQVRPTPFDSMLRNSGSIAW